MPTSLAVWAFGTILQRGDGATPEVFTAIAELRDVSGPALGADMAEVTNHGSTGGWEEHITTVLRSGEVTFSLNFIPTGATHSFPSGLIKDLVNRTRRNFKLIFPNVAATTWSFTAVVTAFTPKMPVAAELGADVTLKVTGIPTLA